MIWKYLESGSRKVIYWRDIFCDLGRANCPVHKLHATTSPFRVNKCERFSFLHRCCVETPTGERGGGEKWWEWSRWRSIVLDSTKTEIWAPKLLKGGNFPPQFLPAKFWSLETFCPKKFQSSHWCCWSTLSCFIILASNHCCLHPMIVIHPQTRLGKPYEFVAQCALCLTWQTTSFCWSYNRGSGSLAEVRAPMMSPT